MIGEDICIERKDYSDFLRSIFDGRLFKQSHDMRDAYKKPAIVIVGEFREIFKGVRVASMRGYNVDPERYPESIIGAKSTLLKMGYPVYEVRDDTQYIMLIDYLSRDKKEQAYIAPKPRSVTWGDVRRNMFGCIPSIGAKTATILEDHFENFFKVVECVYRDDEELEELEKVVTRRSVDKLIKALGEDRGKRIDE